MLMAAAALLESNSNPSDDEIDAAMTNLFRCGGYPRIKRAIRRAGEAMRGVGPLAPPPHTGSDEATSSFASTLSAPVTIDSPPVPVLVSGSGAPTGPSTAARWRA